MFHAEYLEWHVHAPSSNHFIVGSVTIAVFTVSYPSTHVNGVTNPTSQSRPPSSMGTLSMETCSKHAGQPHFRLPVPALLQVIQERCSIQFQHGWFLSICLLMLSLTNLIIQFFISLVIGLMGAGNMIDACKHLTQK